MSDSENETKLLITKKWLDSRLIESMFAHQAATREELAKYYHARAGDMFIQGNDELAKYFRDVMVSELLKSARALRLQQDNQKKITEACGAPYEWPDASPEKSGRAE